MNPDCLGEESSKFTDERNNDEEKETLHCNRIFLNFTRQQNVHPKDDINLVKVKNLFKYLSERQDLQEMKVSGWSEEVKSEVDEEDDEKRDEEKDELASYYECGSTPKGGGQRFAMSRDFWYRKLNTLKAQKLDEVALEAKDVPPSDNQNQIKCLKFGKDVFASEIPENPCEIMQQINLFEKSVAKPVEKELKKRFVNVYDNRKNFMGSCS